MWSGGKFHHFSSSSSSFFFLSQDFLGGKSFCCFYSLHIDWLLFAGGVEIINNPIIQWRNEKTSNFQSKKRVDCCTTAAAGFDAKLSTSSSSSRSSGSKRRLEWQKLFNSFHFTVHWDWISYKIHISPLRRFPFALAINNTSIFSSN